jgi:hypothetical protein
MKSRGYGFTSADWISNVTPFFCDQATPVACQGDGKQKEIPAAVRMVGRPSGDGALAERDLLVT